MTGSSSVSRRRILIADIISLSARWWAICRGVHSPLADRSSSSSVMPRNASITAGGLPYSDRSEPHARRHSSPAPCWLSAAGFEHVHQPHLPHGHLPSTKAYLESRPLGRLVSV